MPPTRLKVLETEIEKDDLLVYVCSIEWDQGLGD